MAEDKTIIMPDNQNGFGNVPFALTLPWLGNGYGNGGLLGGGSGGGNSGGGGYGQRSYNDRYYGGGYMGDGDPYPWGPSAMMSERDWNELQERRRRDSGGRFM